MKAGARRNAMTACQALGAWTASPIRAETSGFAGLGISGPIPRMLQSSTIYVTFRLGGKTCVI